MSREFREGLAPLVERGLLGCVVVQFPWYFDDTEAHRARISNIAESLSPLPIAVELSEEALRLAEVLIHVFMIHRRRRMRIDHELYE